MKENDDNIAMDNSGQVMTNKANEGKSDSILISLNVNHTTDNFSLK